MMKIANIREFRSKATAYLREDEPVLITRHGKITGLLYPIRDTDTLPTNVRMNLEDLLSAEKSTQDKVRLLDGLKASMSKKKVSIEDVKILQKQWKFKGSLSADIIAERDKR